MPPSKTEITWGRCFTPHPQSPVRPAQQTDGPWRRTVDCRKPNQVGGLLLQRLQGHSCPFTVLPQGCLKSAALCHDSVCSDLSHLSLPQDITLVHYGGGMPIGSNEQGGATTLGLLVRHRVVRMWEINLNKIQRSPLQGNA